MACDYTAILLLIGALALGGCASVRYPEVDFTHRGAATIAPSGETVQRIHALGHALIDLSPTVDPLEAQRLAEAAVLYPMQLANRYQLVAPPLLHNTLVNSGLRPRGLCREWTEDLMNHLRTLDPRSFELHWGIAHKGRYYSEHSSVVVTARGQDFADGIVLDGWRHSGRLVWVRVGDDKYPWIRYR